MSKPFFLPITKNTAEDFVVTVDGKEYVMELDATIYQKSTYDEEAHKYLKFNLRDSDGILFVKKKPYNKFPPAGSTVYYDLGNLNQIYQNIKPDAEYFIINDSRLSKIVGKGGVKSRTAVIKNLLISNKVVESIPYRFKEKSTGFRLTNEYISGEFINIPFSDDILNNLKKYEFADYEQYKDLIDGKYSHLAYNFKVNEFNILDDDLKLALRNLLEIANQMVVNKRKYSNVSLKSLLSYIGKNLAQLNKLVVGDTNVSVSTSNNRLYSVLSQVPRLFRRFLQINNKDIGEVDISACQLYILDCIFSTDFSISTSRGFNLKTIYPDLYKKIKDFDFINP